jgi:hypothetical protein
MSGRFDMGPLHDVLWPDASIRSISIDYHSVAIHLRESTGRKRVLTCRGYIGYQLVGFWDEVVVERAELNESDPFLSDCLRRIDSVYHNDPPETGDPIRNRRSWNVLLIHLGDGSVLRVAGADFSVNSE